MTKHKEEKRDTAQIIFWVVVGLLVVVFLSQFIFKGSTSKLTEEVPNYNPNLDVPSAELTGMDAFAKCLTEKGATFYGTEWCSHCNNQKKLFGDSLQYVNFVDCEKNPSICSREGITGYPTWKLGDGTPLVGGQQLSTLASATGCEL